MMIVAIAMTVAHPGPQAGEGMQCRYATFTLMFTPYEGD
jgi:hypothetical protein